MPRMEVITCAVCSQQKQDVNHWFMFKVTHSILSLMPWDSNEYLNGWDYLCGQVCMHKIVDQTMGGVYGIRQTEYDPQSR